ncbi:MAG: Radical protein [Candidatus Hydrogenedentes bacterium]|nr:Radical protein [Candidatus Hydrogenedentota bacterium]
MLDDVRPGPNRIQIQTQSGCDGRCVFCPNKDIIKAGLPQGRMEPELFRKIIDELAETRPRRISPYLMNEPLLDKRLPEFVRYITEKVPDATTLVTTNGTHLDRDLGKALIEAGLKRIKVSLQSLDADTNKRLMGAAVDSGEVVENVLGMRALIKETRSELDLRVSMIVTKLNLDEIDRARRFWRKNGVRLVTSALENRGGNIGDAQSLNPHEMTAMGGDCVRPNREMCVLFNGDAVLCCVDWFRTTILGNVGETSVRDVWNGPRIEAIRQGLRAGDGAVPKICRNCCESASPDSHRRGLKGIAARWFGARKKETAP